MEGKEVTEPEDPSVGHGGSVDNLLAVCPMERTEKAKGKRFVFNTYALHTPRLSPVVDVFASPKNVVKKHSKTHNYNEKGEIKDGLL
jgi:hypothetical protein